MELPRQSGLFDPQASMTRYGRNALLLKNGLLKIEDGSNRTPRTWSCFSDSFHQEMKP